MAQLERQSRFEATQIQYHTIFGGVIIALALQLLLTLLGEAIGFALVPNITSLGALSTGTVLSSLGVPLICFLLGGLASAMISALDRASTGTIYGILVWGLGLLFLASLSAATGTNWLTAPAKTNEVFWLAFFSQCLALLGAGFGGYLGSRPLHRVVYRERALSERAVS